MSSGQQIGMPQARLDEIELRLAGADRRPWELNRALRDENGRALITMASKKQLRKEARSADILRDDLEAQRATLEKRITFMQEVSDLLEQGKINDKDAAVRILNFDKKNPQENKRSVQDVNSIAALFKLCDNATEDMGDFVANAPQDIEDLLNEVKFIRKRMRDAETSRDEFKKEMLSLRVEKAALQDKLSTVRRHWRDFTKEIG